MKRKAQFVFVAMAHPMGTELPSQVYEVVGVFKKLKSAKLATQVGWHPDVLAATSWTQNQYRTRYTAIWNRSCIGKVLKVKVMP